MCSGKLGLNDAQRRGSWHGREQQQLLGRGSGQGGAGAAGGFQPHGGPLSPSKAPVGQSVTSRRREVWCSLRVLADRARTRQLGTGLLHRKSSNKSEVLSLGWESRRPRSDLDVWFPLFPTPLQRCVASPRWAPLAGSRREEPALSSLCSPDLAPGGLRSGRRVGQGILSACSE